MRLISFAIPLMSLATDADVVPAVTPSRNGPHYLSIRTAGGTRHRGEFGLNLIDGRPYLYSRLISEKAKTVESPIGSPRSKASLSSVVRDVEGLDAGETAYHSAATSIRTVNAQTNEEGHGPEEPNAAATQTKSSGKGSLKSAVQQPGLPGDAGEVRKTEERSSKASIRQASRKERSVNDAIHQAATGDKEQSTSRKSRNSDSKATVLTGPEFGEIVKMATEKRRAEGISPSSSVARKSKGSQTSSEGNSVQEVLSALPGGKKSAGSKKAQASANASLAGSTGSEKQAVATGALSERASSHRSKYVQDPYTGFYYYPADYARLPWAPIGPYGALNPQAREVPYQRHAQPYKVCYKYDEHGRCVTRKDTYYARPASHRIPTQTQSI